MNSIHLMGRLTKDVETRTTPTTTIGKASIAVDRPKYKDKEKVTDFFNLVMFGKQAEIFAQYVSKGQRVLIEGSLQINVYENKEGVTVRSPEILVSKFHFVEKKEKMDTVNYSQQSAPGNNQPDKTSDNVMGAGIPF